MIDDERKTNDERQIMEDKRIDRGKNRTTCNDGRTIDERHTERRRKKGK